MTILHVPDSHLYAAGWHCLQLVIRLFAALQGWDGLARIKVADPIIRTMRGLLDDVPAEKLASVRMGLERLTSREREILRHAILGETAGDCAVNLGISRRTVELHRQQVLTKLGVRNLVQAVRMIALVERE